MNRSPIIARIEIWATRSPDSIVRLRLVFSEKYFCSQTYNIGMTKHLAEYLH